MGEERKKTHQSVENILVEDTLKKLSRNPASFSLVVVHRKIL